VYDRKMADHGAGNGCLVRRLLRDTYLVNCIVLEGVKW
jgi:hypothetical protein